MKTEHISELSAQEIGRRLRVSRGNAGVRQEDAARVIGVSRPTLVAIEQGKRRPRIQEIMKLAEIYDVSTNALLRPEAVHTDIIARFRRAYGLKKQPLREDVQ